MRSKASTDWGIKPTKIGNKFYISGKQLDLLDQLGIEQKFAAYNGNRG